MVNTGKGERLRVGEKGREEGLKLGIKGRIKGGKAGRVRGGGGLKGVGLSKENGEGLRVRKNGDGLRLEIRG
jgi:hypothetical protein